MPWKHEARRMCARITVPLLKRNVAQKQSLDSIFVSLPLQLLVVPQVVLALLLHYVLVVPQGECVLEFHYVPVVSQAVSAPSLHYGIAVQQVVFAFSLLYLAGEKQAEFAIHFGWRGYLPHLCECCGVADYHPYPGHSA
eukprot:2263270-Amphidinium_carterae.1